MPRPNLSILELALASALLLGAASPGSALEIVDLQLDHAFSPNGDGVQDKTLIEFGVESAHPIIHVSAGIYASAEIPWDQQEPPEALALLLDESFDPAVEEYQASLSWPGTDTGGALLPDGLYYLHILAVDSVAVDDLTQVFLDPPRQVLIDTAPQNFHSLYHEPSPHFTPLAAGAETTLKLVFASTDFNLLSDTGTALIVREDPEEGDLAVAELDLDPGWEEDEGELRFHRWVWDGVDGEGEIVDGSYRAELTLSDDAGNAGDEAVESFDLDALAPGIRVLRFGAGGAGETTFHFPPSALPESLLVRCVDRNGVDPGACLVDWDLQLGWEPGGFLYAQSADTSVFGFRLPVEAYVAAYENPDSSVATHRFKIDAADLPGNSAEALGSLRTITLTLDGVAPPTPQWITPGGTRIQSLATLEGTCAELTSKVIVYEDGDSVTTVTVNTELRFTVYVQLSVGSHEWTARSQDAAGNRSPSSEPLTLEYRPGAAIQIPGRLRGRAGESLRVNSAADADGVSVRIYTLEGELVRLLDLEGTGREFSGEWDLADADGRAVMDGLYVFNVEIRSAKGGSSYERKVVAVVRD